MGSPALFLCRIGWHDACAGGVWNGGYCFTTCRRCGRDMVRSMFGEWHVPKGFRVVWRHAAASPVLPEPVSDRPSATERDDPPVQDDPLPAARSPFDFSEFDTVERGGDRAGRRPAPPAPRETTRFRR